MKPLRRTTRARIFCPDIERYLPPAILLFLPNRNELSVTERFLVFFLRLPLRWAACESEIGAASHRSECRFPDEVKTCFWPFCPDLFAVHRAGAEDNPIIGKKCKKRGARSALLSGLIEIFFSLDHRTGGVIRSLLISSNGDCCPRKGNQHRPERMRNDSHSISLE